jgi:hypothetical protein
MLLKQREAISDLLLDEEFANFVQDPASELSFKKSYEDVMTPLGTLDPGSLSLVQRLDRSTYCGISLWRSRRPRAQGPGAECR